MAPRRAIEVVRQGAECAEAPKWRMSLLENTFTSFITSSPEPAKVVFAEGSLFSPYLLGKFFDPADAFPLWEFESDVLLAGLRRGGRTTVDWAENDCEYCLRAEIPGGRKCDVEASGDCGRVLDVSGLWRAAAPSDGRDWRAGKWWEHGFVRRVELPEDADGARVEAYFDDSDGLLEIKVPKKKGGDAAA